VKIVAGQRAVEQLDAADFDDAVSGSWVQAGGFGIEDNLAHGWLVLSLGKAEV
jgi:hypothetical protein